MSTSKNIVPKLKLNNGYEIPVLGLGTYKVKFSFEGDLRKNDVDFSIQ